MERFSVGILPQSIPVGNSEKLIQDLKMIQNKPPASSKLTFDRPERGSARIVVTIKTQEVEQELAKFSKMFQSIAYSVACDYQQFVSSKYPEHADRCVLLVKDIRAGSVVVDLFQAIAPLLPAGDSIQLATGFIQFYEKNLLPYFRIGGRSDNVEPATLRAFDNMLRSFQPYLNGEQTMEAVYRESDGTRKVTASIKIKGSKVRTGRGELKKHMKEIEIKRPPGPEHKRVVMQFKRSDRGDARIGKLSGERVIVPDISHKDIPLIYGTEQAKAKIKNEIRKPDGNVFEKGFMVDLCMDMKNNKLHAYRVKKVHNIVNFAW